MDPEGYGYGPSGGHGDFAGRGPAHKRARYDHLPPPPLRPDGLYGVDGAQGQHSLGSFAPARSQRRFSQSPPRLMQPGTPVQRSRARVARLIYLEPCRAKVGKGYGSTCHALRLTYALSGHTLWIITCHMEGCVLDLIVTLHRGQTWTSGQSTATGRQRSSRAAGVACSYACRFASAGAHEEGLQPMMPICMPRMDNPSTSALTCSPQLHHAACSSGRRQKRKRRKNKPSHA